MIYNFSGEQKNQVLLSESLIFCGSATLQNRPYRLQAVTCQEGKIWSYEMQGREREKPLAGLSS